MGNNVTNIEQEQDRQEQESELKSSGGNDPSSHDPRSPSKDVSRTPLKMDNPPVEQSRIDPRSPSGCINRTPIEISKSAVHKETDGVRMVLRYENRSS